MAEEVQENQEVEQANTSDVEVEPKIEFDYSLEAEAAEGTEGEQVEAAPEPEVEAEVEAKPQPSADMRELMDRIDRAERRANEAEALVFRVAKGEGKDVSDQPPVDPKNIRSVDDLMAYQDWKHQRALSQVRAEAAQDALAASSDQRARGIFTDTSIKPGYSYDSLLARHIEPLERQNPAIKQLFKALDDPAMAKYTLAFSMELARRFEGDPTKTFKQILDALDGKGREVEKVVQKIKQAEVSAASKLRGKITSKRPEGRQKITAEQIDKMSPREFLELMKRTGSSL